jgi:recombination protein RecA
MAKQKSVHIEHETTQDRDKLAVLLQKALNNRRKDGLKVAHFLGEADDPSVITDWVSTGSTSLDLAISNRPYGGLPVGRIVELNGLESTCKSLISAHIIANTQKKGGMAVMIDSENSAAPQFWASLGVNLNDLLYAQYDSLEEMFDGMEIIIGEARKEQPDRLLTIIFDSVAGAPTKKELESDHSVDGYNTAKSIIMGKSMRKLTGLIGRQRILPVFTNQLRMNMNAMAFGDKYVVPGGKALAYHASVRVRLANVGKIKDSNKQIIGNSIQAQVLKNRCGPPFRVAKFDVHYDSGIQDLVSLLDHAKEFGIITGTKAGYVFKTKSNGDVKFNVPKFVELYNTDVTFKDEFYGTICDRYVMKYRSPNSAIVEEAEYSEGDVEDEIKGEIVEE